MQPNLLFINSVKVIAKSSRQKINYPGVDIIYFWAKRNRGTGGWYVSVASCVCHPVLRTFPARELNYTSLLVSQLVNTNANALYRVAKHTQPHTQPRAYYKGSFHGGW